MAVRIAAHTCIESLHPVFCKTYTPDGDEQESKCEDVFKISQPDSDH